MIRSGWCLFGIQRRIFPVAPEERLLSTGEGAKRRRLGLRIEDHDSNALANLALRCKDSSRIAKRIPTRRSLPGQSHEGPRQLVRLADDASKILPRHSRSPSHMTYLEEFAQWVSARRGRGSRLAAGGLPFGPSNSAYDGGLQVVPCRAPGPDPPRNTRMSCTRTVRKHRSS